MKYIKKINDLNEKVIIQIDGKKSTDLPIELQEEISFLSGRGGEDMYIWTNYGRYFIGLGKTSDRIKNLLPIIDRYKNTDMNLGYDKYYSTLYIDTLIRVKK